MRFFALVFASLSLGTAAHAAKITCDGDYAGYHVNIHATAQKRVVVGDIRIVITNGKEVVRQATLRADSSEVVAGQHIRASGHGNEGTGNINATYSARSGMYHGDLNVDTNMGSAQIPMTCSLTGSSIFTNGFEVIDLEDYVY